MKNNYEEASSSLTLIINSKEARSAMFARTSAGVCKHKTSHKKHKKCDLVNVMVRLCVGRSRGYVCVCLTDRRLFEGLCQAEFCGQMSLQDAVRSQCDRCPHVKTPTVPLIELVP